MQRPARHRTKPLPPRFANSAKALNGKANMNHDPSDNMNDDGAHREIARLERELLRSRLGAGRPQSADATAEASDSVTAEPSDAVRFGGSTRSAEAAISPRLGGSSPLCSTRINRRCRSWWWLGECDGDLFQAPNACRSRDRGHASGRLLRAVERAATARSASVGRQREVHRRTTPKSVAPADARRRR